MRKLLTFVGAMSISLSAFAGSQAASDLRVFAVEAVIEMERAKIGKSENGLCYQVGAAKYPVTVVQASMLDLTAAGYKTGELSELVFTLSGNHKLMSEICANGVNIQSVSNQFRNALTEAIAAAAQISGLQMELKK